MPAVYFKTTAIPVFLVSRKLHVENDFQLTFLILVSFSSICGGLVPRASRQGVLSVWETGFAIVCILKE